MLPIHYSFVCSFVLSIELNHPLMPKAMRENISTPEFKDLLKDTSLRTPMCLAAAELGGSRMSRVVLYLFQYSSVIG